jgi:hypothetical protein
MPARSSVTSMQHGQQGVGTPDASWRPRRLCRRSAIDVPQPAAGLPLMIHCRTLLPYVNSSPQKAGSRRHVPELGPAPNPACDEPRFVSSRLSIERSRKGRASTAGRHCQIILTGNFLLRTSSDLPQPVIPARIVEQRPRPGIFPNPVFLVVEIPARQLPLLYRPRTPFHV